MGCREHRVSALIGVLDHLIAGIVDEVHVVAGAAEHGVGTRAAVEEVVAGVAVDQVGVAVAVALQVGIALQDQGVHVRRQPEVSRREHRIEAFARVLDHLIAGIVDEVHVVAGAAEHGVGTRAAVEEVVAGVAVHQVGVAVAVALQVGIALENQGFHVRRQPKVSRREHRVDSPRWRSRPPIVGIVDEVHVVAGPADMVSAPASPSRILLPALPVMRVGAGIAVGLQIGAARQGQVFDVRRQPVMTSTHDRVGALVGTLDHRVAGIVDKVDVVADTTDQGVRADTAIERIIAPFAEKRIRACLRGQGVVAPLAMDYVARSCTAQRVVVCRARE